MIKILIELVLALMMIAGALWLTVVLVGIGTMIYELWRDKHEQLETINELRQSIFYPTQYTTRLCGRYVTTTDSRKRPRISYTKRLHCWVILCTVQSQVTRYSPKPQGVRTICVSSK